MKKIKACLFVFLLMFSMLFVTIPVSAFEREVHDFDKIWYSHINGFNKNGDGTLILATTYTNNSFRNIDYCNIEFTQNPFYFAITLQDELYIQRDSEGNIIYQEPSDGYIFLRKSVVDTYIPEIKRLATRGITYKTITFQSVQWYRISVPNFNRQYEWKEYQTPVKGDKWYTWGSNQSIEFETRAMHIQQTVETNKHLEFDFSHPTDNSGQVVSFSKSYLLSKGITTPYFEWGEVIPWRQIGYIENETHYFIHPEHFSWVGIHEASSGEFNASITSTQSPTFDVNVDFTTFTEVDSDNRWAKTTTKCTVTNADRDEVDYIYKDYGVGYFSSHWRHSFTTNITSNIHGGFVYLYIQSNEISDYLGMTNGIGIYFFQDGGSLKIGLVDKTGVSDLYINAAHDGTKSYYMVLIRSGTTLTLEIYNDTDITSLLDTLSITMVNINYRYLYGGSTRNDGSSGYAISGYIKNLGKPPFVCTRTAAASSEVNNFSINPSYNHSGNVTLVVPVSTSVSAIIDVTNNTAGLEATSVNTSGELVNNTFWYDSANQFIHIRTVNLTTSSTVNWTINCTYGSEFSVSPPTYLPLGHPFEFIGLIKDADGVGISGHIATTKIMYTNGTNAVTPVEHNCSGGNIFVTISTTSLTPGEYLWEISFLDVDSGVTFKKGGSLSLSIGTSGHYESKAYFNIYDDTTGTASHSPEFTYYDPNTGVGIDLSFLKLYVSDTTSFTESDRISIRDFMGDFNTYTGQVLYYKVLDFFDNVIYPTVGDYATVTIEYIDQFIDIPIQMWSFSVKNMNHSIVKFELHNNSRAYIQYLFPYEPFYWYVFNGTYDINITYIDPDTDENTNWLNTTINIDNHSYYWIKGYDLQDIILEIQFTNTSVDSLEITITADISFVNSTVNSITSDISTNIALFESNITTINNNIWNTINITDSVVDYVNSTIWNELNYINNNISWMNSTTTYVNDTIWNNFTIVGEDITVLNISIHNAVDLSELNLTALNINIWNDFNLTDAIIGYLNNTIWNNFSIVDAVVDNINNKLTINFDMLNVTVDYINNTIWTEFNTVNSNIDNLEIDLRNTMTFTETNITNMNSNIWNAINISDSIIDYLNLTVWTNFTALGNDISSLNVSFINTITLAENNITSIQLSFWGDINTTLKNRSVVMFGFYNTNDGLGLRDESFKVYINGTRLTDQSYWCTNGSIINVTVLDYYNSTMFHQNFTIIAPYTFIDLGLTFHSWLFGNKNDKYYMVSLLKDGATRWWERGIVPMGEREFMLPSGNYTMRIYDADWTELYNASHVVNRSMVYVIHGNNLSTVIAGQSVITGQLLELSTEIDYALMPDIEIISFNPPMIFSIYDKEGMSIGTNVYKICPALITIATTKVETTGNWINTTAKIPGNDTIENGTITIVDDELFIFGSNAINYINITYTSNGTLLQNTTYIPGKINLYGQALTINASGNIYILRETTYNQLKKFYWAYDSSTGEHTAGIDIINPMNVAIHDVYSYVEFSNKSTPDPNTVVMRDITNAGIVLKRGENYDISLSGIHFYLLSIESDSTRAFTFEYYKRFDDAYSYGEASIGIPGYIETVWNGLSFNTFSIGWINPENTIFRGALYVKFEFDTPTEINSNSIRIWDENNNCELNKSKFVSGSDYIRISAAGLGDVSPGGGRSFSVYFLLSTYPGLDPTKTTLNTPLFKFAGISFTPFLIILLIVLSFMGYCVYAYMYKKNQKVWKNGIVLGAFILFIFFVMSYMGV